jgi:oligopeptide/dipeptide ABC transporter ATP-binding protein
VCRHDRKLFLAQEDVFRHGWWAARAPQALLKQVAGSARIPLPGTVPSSVDPPSGCRFHTRCFKAQAVCSAKEPPLEDVGPRRQKAACFFAEPRQMI